MLCSVHFSMVERSQGVGRPLNVGGFCVCLGLLHILTHTRAVIENKFAGIMKVLTSLLEG